MGMDFSDAVGSVICSIDMHFSSDGLDSAVRLLTSVVGRTTARPGCVDCVVALDATEPDRVRYYESWDSGLAFHNHVRSAEFRRVLSAMDMCCEEPRVVIGNLSGGGGMAQLQELCGSNAAVVAMDGET